MSGDEEPAEAVNWDERISRPSAGVVAAVRGLRGTVAVLGAGGKMGLHVSLMVKRALEEAGNEGARVVAVSRFGSEAVRAKFAEHGLERVAADLCDRGDLAGLPEAENVFFLAGVKFGTAAESGLLEKLNVEMPRRVAERFRDSRLVALSTGCVYPYVTPATGGSKEADATGPTGAYAESCLGRETVFREGSERWGTRCALIRLNYSVEVRYGVLVDIGQKVLAGEPVDVSMGYVNVIWQGDAVAQIVRALGNANSPPFVLNVAGGEVLRVRDLAERFGEIFGKPARIEGVEGETAWLSDSSKAGALFGEPQVRVEQMIEWVGEWLSAGGETLGKPTKFEVRDGNF